MKNREDKLQNLMLKKRDGRSVPFDFQKLYLSLERSNNDLEEALSQKELTQVQEALEEQVSQLEMDFISTGELRQLVVEWLLRENQKELVASYQAYAEKKEQERLAALDINQAIHKLLEKDSRLVNENANKDADVFNTQRDLTAGIVGKAIGLKLLPSHVANAHQKGDIHFHDLDYNPYTPMTNCCLIDFEGMLAQGFKIGNAEVESPKSIQTATAQISQIIANVSSSQYGGCSADRIDQILAPYAELNYQKHLKEAEEWVQEGKAAAYALKKTKKDIYDAMQSLEYEINTLFTSNGQTPFTSLGFGLGTSWFEREIQKAILNIRIQGLGREGRTAIFPKLIFTLKRGLNLEPGSPNYDINPSLSL